MGKEVGEEVGEHWDDEAEWGLRRCRRRSRPGGQGQALGRGEPVKLDTLVEIVRLYAEDLDDPAAREVLLVLDEALARLGYEPRVRRALFRETLDRCHALLHEQALARRRAAQTPRSRPAPYRDLPPGGLRSLPEAPGIKGRGVSGRRIA